MRPSEKWEWLVQPVSPRVVELLNDALTFELTVTNTYFLNARMLDAWGLPSSARSSMTCRSTRCATPTT